MLRKPLILLAFGLLVFAGCNVFEGFYEEGASDDAEVLIGDADAALQRGEPDKAVQYLEKALEAEPSNPKVRTKLSTALLQENDLDVITMVNLAEDITGNTNGSSSKSGSMAACNFTGAAVEEIDLTLNPSYLLVADQVELLRRIKALLNPVINTTTLFNDLSPILQNTALLNQAISTVLVVFIDVQERSDALGATLWRLPNQDVGLCADDESALIEIQEFVKCEKIPEMQLALDLLQQRLGSSGGDSAAKEAIEEIEDSIDQLATQIAVTCG